MKREKMKQKAMISRCMIGDSCRYDGKSKPLEKEILDKLKQQYELIPFCPEAEYLPTPRPAVRFVNDKLIDINGIDKTLEFEKGASKALKICKKEKISIFIGKEKSPSCGIQQTSACIDGKECKIEGMGLTSKLLKTNGIKVISEWDL